MNGSESMHAVENRFSSAFLTTAIVPRIFFLRNKTQSKQVLHNFFEGFSQLLQFLYLTLLQTVMKKEVNRNLWLASIHFYMALKLRVGDMVTMRL